MLQVFYLRGLDRVTSKWLVRTAAWRLFYMDRLLPHETELIGNWIESHGVIQGDAVCDRIQRLTGGILSFVQDHPKHGGWTALFLDHSDGRYWERYYPESGMHGGGPPALRYVSHDELAAEYDFLT